MPCPVIMSCHVLVYISCPIHVVIFPNHSLATCFKGAMLYADGPPFFSVPQRHTANTAELEWQAYYHLGKYYSLAYGLPSASHGRGHGWHVPTIADADRPPTSNIPQEPPPSSVPQEPPPSSVPQEPPPSSVPQEPPPSSVPQEPPSSSVPQEPSPSSVPQEPPPSSEGSELYCRVDWFSC